MVEIAVVHIAVTDVSGLSRKVRAAASKFRYQVARGIKEPDVISATTEPETCKDIGSAGRIQIVTGEHSMETLAQKRLRLMQEAQLAAEASIADDPVVRKLIDRTDGEVVKDSIQPVAAKPDSEIVIQRTAEISE